MQNPRQKIKSIKNPIKHSFNFFYFIKSETSDSFVNHFDGHFAYLKTLDFYFKVLNVILKSKFRVKDNTKELCFDYFYGCFSQKNVRVWEKNVLLMEMNTDRLGGGELEAVLRHSLLNAVYTQLHSSLHSV